MIRKSSLLVLMGLVVMAAATSGISTPAWLLMSGLIVLAFFITSTHDQKPE